MAENTYLDLTVEVACERFNLDEHDWTLVAFSESAKTISVSLEHDMDGTKLRTTFAREEIRFEEMKRWSEERKLAFLQGMVEAGKELPSQLVDSFQHAMLKLELPTAEPSVEDSVLVEEETEQQFEKKVGKVFKRKTV